MKGFWVTCIVDALENLGGEADMVDIYLAVESLNYLGKKDMETSNYQQRPNYTHSLRSCAARMVKKEELIRIRGGRFRLP